MNKVSLTFGKKALKQMIWLLEETNVNTLADVIREAVCIYYFIKKNKCKVVTQNYKKEVIV